MADDGRVVQELQEVPGFCGLLILALDGSVVRSSGPEFERAAKPVFDILQNTNVLLSSSGKFDPFKRLTISDTLNQRQWVVAISNNRIYAFNRSFSRPS
eukprot:gnl/Spiro4/17913_TR9545_c0_g1_i1.p1 gnl/Spiro4/17913_TR9545_c0_g1~~gnl/Spiro4/17913_TR9545_c0_g1_i1.p1  ORF type:complete len:112 (+),score=15.48 gnl/Spiro4/17913_TR9545_c0_g1_i1:42-338(+)